MAQLKCNFLFLVTLALEEPLPGWVDSVLGASGIAVGALMGVIRVCIVDEAVGANIIPLDLTVNGMIVSAKQTYDSFRLRFNVISDDKNNIMSAYSRCFTVTGSTIADVNCRYLYSVRGLERWSTRTIVGTMLGTEYRPVIKIGPKGTLGRHEIRPIHSDPSLGQSKPT